MNNKRLYASLALLSIITTLTAMLPSARSVANNQSETDSHALFLPLIFRRIRAKPILDPYLVKDIYSDIAIRAPYCGAVLGDELICYEALNETLWKTDGTQDGTSEVADIFVYRLGERWMLNYEGLVYFASSDGLWRTDGTELGTKLVNGEPHFGGISGPQFIQAGDLFYFAANDYELWRSNGQELGTTMLKKFDDGVLYLTEFKGELYFAADDGLNGYELWKSDGTSGGTVMIKDINPYGWSSPTSLTVAGDKLYFAADWPNHQRSLWMTDGSESGTQPLHENIRNNGLVSFQDQLYYWTRSYISGADDGELWRTDGTASGIEKITDALVPYYVIAADSLFYFFPEEGMYQPEVWRSDGTVGGTFALNAPLPPGFDERYFADQTLVSGDHLFFRGFDEQSGIEPWISDGTVSGTRLLADIYPDVENSSPYNFQLLGDNVYFAARFPGGEAYWVTNRQFAGAEKALGLFSTDVHGSDPMGLTAVGDRLFFAPDDGIHGRELWVSYGSEGNTDLVKDIEPGPNSSAALVGYPGGLSFKNNLIFIVNARELWRSSGSEANTTAIYTSKEVPDSQIQLLSASENLVYFIDGNSLLAGDGNPSGNKMLATLNDGFPGGNAVESDRLYMLYYDSGTPSGSFWTSKGTAASTKQILNGIPYPFRGPVILDGLAYFTTGSDLWQSDGTSAATKVAATVSGGEINGLTTAGGQLFLSVKDEDGWSIWLSSGSQKGTEFLKTVNTAAHDEYINSLTAFGSSVIFEANDGQHGFELWISDGTSKGTKLLKDIANGEGSSRPDWITPVARLVFFSADDGTHGQELWVSDGSEAGTKMVADLVAPGGGGPHNCQEGGSCPNELTVAGNRLYFAAEEDDGDVELWALELDD